MDCDWLDGIGEKIESERDCIMLILIMMGVVLVGALGAVVGVGVWAAVKTERHAQWRDS
jgi:hypothetical protein